MKHYLSLGAGVQSSTLALMSEHGELDTPFDAAIFADTQAEPQEVYDWLDWLEQQLSYPVYRVTRGDLRKETLKLRTSKKTGQKYIRALVPAFFESEKSRNGRGLLGRKCTAEYKIRVLQKTQRQLAKVPRAKKGVKRSVSVVTAIGISTDEAERMRISTEDWNTLNYPLIDRDMSRLDCLKWMQEKSYPLPPRSACYFCPFHNDNEWIRLRDEHPEEFAKAVKFDRDLRRMARKQTGTAKLAGDVFLHDSLIPLDKVEFKPSHDPVNHFRNECKGLCGV